MSTYGTGNNVWVSLFNTMPSASGGFALRPPPGLRPWTPLGDFRPPDLLVARRCKKNPAGAHEPSWIYGSEKDRWDNGTGGVGKEEKEEER